MSCFPKRKKNEQKKKCVKIVRFWSMFWRYESLKWHALALSSRFLHARSLSAHLSLSISSNQQLRFLKSLSYSQSFIIFTKILISVRLIFPSLRFFTFILLCFFRDILASFFSLIHCLL